MQYYLAIDQGSHSSRALLFDDKGREVAGASRAVTLTRYDESRVEHDAGELLESVNAVIRKLLDGLDENVINRIAACGIATQRSTVLAWNDRGEAVGPVLSWQDVRAAAFVESLAQHETEIQQLTGLPLSPHYGASKLRWLLTGSAEVAAQQVQNLRLSPLVSFLLYHLLESHPCVVDHTNAQRTQLMDISTLDWSPRLAQLFDVPLDCLPRCMPMCAHYGVLQQVPVPVTAVCGDQNAALHGAGELSQDTALVNIGSGAFILRTLPALAPAGRQLNGISWSDSGSVQYLREATINGAGSAIDWVSERYDIGDVWQRMPGWLETVKDPPLFINSIGGLGSPWWRQQPAPHFIDERKLDDGARMVAVVESIVFMVRANIELMQQVSPVKKLRVSGGLSSSDGLCQKLANACRLPVERIHNPEATAKGVARLAAGRPSNWDTADGMYNAENQFSPLLESGLEQRYARYIEKINDKI